MTVLRDGKPAQVLYDTRFLIEWPEHLGGGTLEVDFYGTMVMMPLLAT